MKVCFFGTFEANYDRNRIVQAALRKAGIEVHVCHIPLWEKIRHKTLRFYHPLQVARVIWGMLTSYAILTLRYLQAPDHDVVWIGYLGHLDVLIAKGLAKFRRKPLIFDAFVSLYDTLVLDREVVGPKSLLAHLLHAIDRLSCSLADRVCLDTDAHIDYFVREFNIPKEKFFRLWVGADEAVYFPGPQKANPTLSVLHYSKFSPLHGIPTILEAIAMLDARLQVSFTLVGSGQSHEACDRLIVTLGLKSIRQIDWLDEQSLRDEIDRSDVCLGIFGKTEKAQRVIPNKVYQCMAMQKPIITADTAGARELLRHKSNAYLVPPGDARALADAIMEIAHDTELRNALGKSARTTFVDNCSAKKLGEVLGAVIERTANA